MRHDELVFLYSYGTYMHTDDEGTHHYRNERPVYCGDTRHGERQYCDECMKELNEMYPQGWDYYPGDTCEHGVYVGGCGIDHMCHRCEMGD